ncbi:MAG TPA: hypothetical protein VFZ70_16655 [Euzebyales bacterium]
MRLLRRLTVALIVAAVALWLGSLRDGDAAPAGSGPGHPPVAASVAPADARV